MNSNNNRIDTLREEVTALQSQISSASSKDEALQLAISAAEICMKALKLATSKSDKSDISNQCKTLLDEAERIKSEEWQSSLVSQPNEPIPDLIEFDIPTSTPNVQNSQDNTSLYMSTAIPPNKMSSPSSGDGRVGTPISIPKSEILPPVSRIKMLKEPISTRDLAKSEQILLLRASKLNQFTFPPWKPPQSYEFIIERGQALFFDEPELCLSNDQLKHFNGWKRPNEALPPPTWDNEKLKAHGPVMDSPYAIDLVQDVATDCSVVASLCAIVARFERGHSKMLSQIIYPYDLIRNRPMFSANGKYLIRLNFNGSWRRVTIDDMLPMSKSKRMLHVVDRNNSALLWPALVEKAYLKVRGGYDFPGSNSCSDLWAITGWIPEQLYLPNNDIVPNQLWKRLHNAFLYGDVLITLGTGKMSSKVERELGLEAQHNYVILDMKEQCDEQLLLVKNPWVESKDRRGGRLQQAYSKPVKLVDIDQVSCNDIPSSSSENQLSPGTFWVSMENIMQHFEHLFLNWNPGLFRYRQDLHFGWDMRSMTDQHGCIISHPQLSFSATKGGLVWFLLSRHYRDADVDQQAHAGDAIDGLPPGHSDCEAPPTGFINLYVFDRFGQEVYVSEGYIERGSYVNTPQMLLQWEATASKTYTLAINQMDLPPAGYTFTLSAFSNSEMKLSRAKTKYNVQKVCRGVWENGTAGGNSNSPRYFDNPQYSLHVSQRTSVAILIQSSSREHSIHVKLVHGQGQRVHSLQSRDILVDSGEYRHRCAFAELNDLQPGTYTIICSMFEAHKHADFSLRVDTNTPAELKPIPAEGAGMLSYKLAKAVFGPKDNKVAAQIVPRRLVRVIVVTRLIRPFFPPTGKNERETADFNTRSPLRITFDQGVGPQCKTLISSAGGDYSDKETIRTEHIDLNPTMLQNGDMWLVLDRLSGPANGADESYQVELLCDVPDSIMLGMWKNWDNA